MCRDEYLKKLTKCIQNSEVRSDIMKEYENHISDCKAALMEAGLDEERAEEEAVRQMGSPEEAGVKMNRIYDGLIDWRMLLWFLVCSVAAECFALGFKIAGFGPVYNLTPEGERTMHLILHSAGAAIALLGFVWSAVEKYNNYDLFYAWARNWGHHGLANSGVQLAIAVPFLASDLSGWIRLTLLFGVVQAVIRSAVLLWRRKREGRLLWQIGVAETEVLCYKGRGMFSDKRIRVKTRKKGEEIRQGMPIMIVGFEGAKPVVEQI